MVKTSKNWVLPPRPKPGRKGIKDESNRNLTNDLSNRIKQVDTENLALKSNLLSLIHDYKHLRDLVLRYNSLQPSSPHYTHKRSYNELELLTGINDTKYDEEFINWEASKDISDMLDKELGVGPVDSIDEIVSFPEDIDSIPIETGIIVDSVIPDSLGFTHYQDFENLDKLEDSDLDIDFEDDEYEQSTSSAISRTISPSSDFETNSLMSTLTRSTTVSSMESKKYPFKNGRFFDLPKFEEKEGYRFEFDLTEDMSEGIGLPILPPNW